MCETHYKVVGKEAVEEMILAEVIEDTTCRVSVCDGRWKYLEQQVENFKDWLQWVNPEHHKAIFENIRESIKKLLSEFALDEFIWSREDEEMQESLYDIFKGRDDVFSRLDEEKYMHVAYEMNLRRSADTAFNNEWDEVSHIEERWIEWLSKMDTIYYTNNQYLPKEAWKKCMKARASLNRQRKVKVLDYTTWAMLQNWVNRLSGSSKRFDVPDLPEQDVDDMEIIRMWYSKD